MLTYREIKAVLDNMTDAQLDQEAQIMLSQADHDKPFPLHPVIGLNTVHHFVTPPDSDDEQDLTRSSFDNEHHPESFVLLVDWNMFAEDGTIGFDLETGERIYGKNKKKDVEVEDEFNDTFPTESTQ
jgi:hypothetical protein